MRRIIQVIGLPGSGKTTAIKEFLKQNPDLNVKHIDICNFLGKTRFSDLKKLVLHSKRDLIIETIEGFYSIPSIVIKLEIDRSILKNNLKKRGYVFSNNFLSLMSSQIIKPDYTINSKEELILLLENLFEKEGNATHIREKGSTRSNRYSIR